MPVERDGPHLPGLWLLRRWGLFDILNRLDGDGWFEQPAGHLKDVRSCPSDGYLAAGAVPRPPRLRPVPAIIDWPSPRHRVIHLDPDRGLLVHGKYESVHAMAHALVRAFPRVGVDEMSFRKRHNCVTLVSDTQAGTVLFVGDGRTKKVLKGWYSGLSAEYLAKVESVSMEYVARLHQCDAGACAGCT